MKKLFIAMAVLVCSMSLNAQTMKIMKGDKVVATYTAEQADKIVFEEATASAADANLLPGEFTVAKGKTVKFTKSNLYWDGSAFKFEANQTDGWNTTFAGASWDKNHVSHFYWTNLTDYQSGTESYMPYAQTYSFSSKSNKDKFFCGEDNKITVEGTSGLFVLSEAEWYYLIFTRTNASSLMKYGVSVSNNSTTYKNCLIIAPDGFSGTLKSSYTLAEVNNLGLVCLPAAGHRIGSRFDNGGSYGRYWSSTPGSAGSDSNGSAYAYYLFLRSGDIFTSDGLRSYGRSLRLVVLPQ